MEDDGRRDDSGTLDESSSTHEDNERIEAKTATASRTLRIFPASTQPPLTICGKGVL